MNWRPLHLGKRFVERRTTKYLETPPSVARASAVIVAGTSVIVVAAALIMRFFDREGAFDTMGKALWWSTQTVTTVGYGDLVPHTVAGRIVGVVVMLTGIAFAAVLTAVITSSFVARSQIGAGRTEELIAELDARLDRIEALLDHPNRPMPPAQSDR